MGTFSEALEHLKSNTLVKREVIKNDTVIVNYKNRLYQMSKNTGVRYPYIPTNKDLMANDWIALSNKGNMLVDQSVSSGVDVVDQTEVKTVCKKCNGLTAIPSFGTFIPCDECKF